MQKKYIKNLIFSFLFFAISLAGFFFVINMINKNSNEFIVLREEVKNAEILREEIQKINQNISEILVQAKEVDTHFLEEEDAGIFLDELEKAGLAQNVKVEVVSLDTLKEDMKDFSLNLIAIGSFNDLNNFLFVLENHKYEIDIISYKVQRQSFREDVEALPEWRADIKIKVVSFVSN